MFDWNKVRLDVEKFYTAIQREWYLNWAGLKDELNISAIYKKYQHLFTKELISDVRDARKRAAGEEERKLRYLQEFLVKGHLGMAVKKFTDKSETMQSKEVIKVDGKEIPFRFSVVKIVNEPNREKRDKMYRARNKVIDKINVVLRERMQKLHDKSKGLGYENYMTLFKDVKGIDFHGLEKTMKHFIDRTESIYVNRMDKALREKVSVKLEDAEKHDIAFYFRAKEYDNYFKKEDIVETLKRTLSKMGILLERQRNIYVDTEERPKKSPRAFCAPIRVPEEIKLVIMPMGGHDDYASLFHEAGHSEHHGYVDPELAIEYKRLGDNSVTESFAFLLEYLLMDENWLRQYTSMREVEEYLDFLHLYTLYFLRRYGAKLSYEIKMHTNDLEGMDEVYQKNLEKVLRFRHPKNHYLMDHDDAFYCSLYLRAWIFEAQLRALLKEKYGEQWFNNAEAGSFLRNLWLKGQKHDVIELAQTLGYSGLDMEPLITSLQKRLG